MLTEDWWQAAVTDVRGVTGANQDALAFTVRQMLDMAAPSNFGLTNPEVLARLSETGGASALQSASMRCPVRRTAKVPSVASSKS